MKISGNFCFRRQLHMHPAVTYVYVSSLGCKYSFLGLRAFSTLCQSVDFVNILKRPFPSGRGAFLWTRGMTCGENRWEGLFEENPLGDATGKSRRGILCAPFGAPS